MLPIWITQTGHTNTTASLLQHVYSAITVSEHSYITTFTLYYRRAYRLTTCLAFRPVITLIYLGGPTRELDHA